MTLPKNSHIQFLTFSVAVAFLIGVLSYIFPQVIHEKIWAIYLFLLVISFLIGLMTRFLTKLFSENIFHIMVLAMILRFIASLVFIGLSVWPEMANIILFIADFFVLFLFYLVFDIYLFLSNLRPISK